MTLEETVEYFRDMVEGCGAYELCPCFHDDMEMIKIALSALEKQIKKKPNLWCGKITTCPNCLRAISQTEALDVHCKYCGQFIDWSDTE